MKEKLKMIKAAVLEELKGADIKTELENVRVKYLGKKGELTQILRGMGQLSNEERPVIGKLANQVREDIESLITKASDKLKKNENELKLKSEVIDISMPGRKTNNR